MLPLPASETTTELGDGAISAPLSLSLEYLMTFMWQYNSEKCAKNQHLVSRHHSCPLKCFLHITQWEKTMDKAFVYGGEALKALPHSH